MAGLLNRHRGRVPATRYSARIVLLALAVVAVCVGTSGCGLRGSGSDGDVQAEQQRILRLARHQCSQAAEALLAGDRESFLSWFPAADTAAAAEGREDLGEVFDTLSPLPWRAFSIHVSLVDAARGVYRLRGTGQLGDAGPPDRIAVVRYLEFEGVGDGASVVADRTPDDLRDRYLMALHDPLVVRRPGLIVLGDRRAGERAEVVAAAAARARPRLEEFGIDTRPAVVVTVYGSAADVRDALGIGAPTSRLVFFAHPPLRAVEEHWPTYDVGVMGPWLRDTGAAMDGVLRHELAHAYTVRWFGDDEHPPALLVEGIAQAAEGSPWSVSLREEVTTGNQLWPLPESLVEDDVWAGGDGKAVRLGYQVGGALVDYVVSRWGAGELQPFVQAVAGAEPTEAALDEAFADGLGVTWQEFYDGWRRYVLSQGR
jgi:hypothetical protein